MEDEPFDARPAATSAAGSDHLRRSTPSVPPMSAFGSSSNVTPAAVITPSTDRPLDEDMSTTTSPIKTVRRTTFEDDVSALSNPIPMTTSRSMASPTSSSQNRPPTASGELAPRTPYTFQKSGSYDTNELIRKYGNLSGMPGGLPGGKVSNSSPRKSDAVRGEALRVLDMVDDHLKAPLDVRRTESGGFRMAPTTTTQSADEPYSFQRSTSNNIGGRRVPSALAGMSMSSGAKDRADWNANRQSYSDSNFRHDDQFEDEEEEDAIEHALVDLQRLEARVASSRVNEFEGDYPSGSGKTPGSWSSRYTDTPYTSQKQILDQWDKEFEIERRTARSMIMSTAATMQARATNVWGQAKSSPSSSGSSIFGSGFSFRKNHVYGNQKNANRNDMNLRTAWKDVDLDDVTQGSNTNRVHKTWQEVMLNKKRRRHACAILVTALVVLLIAVTSTRAIQRKKVNVVQSGIGERVSFYITSDVPFTTQDEENFVQDLSKLSDDAQFLVHLGNIQQAEQTFCPQNIYSEVASVLSESPIPTFVLPGEQDWVRCPYPLSSYDTWLGVFQDFDLQFDHGYEVFRNQDYPEAFAINRNGVLFVGLNVVNGPVADPDSWSYREGVMLGFLYGMAEYYEGAYRAVVVLGNGSATPQMQGQLRAMADMSKELDMPFAYIHASDGSDEIVQYKPFTDEEKFFAMSGLDGGSSPPLRITVGFGDNPFTVSNF